MLLIDGPNWVWRAYWVGKELRDTNGAPTSIFHFGLQMLGVLGDLFQPQHVVFLWDSSRSWRRELYPEYKQNRRPKTEEERKNRALVFDQLDRFRDILDWLAISQVEVEGLEADDLASIYVRHHSQELPLILVSNDKDWYQLLAYRGVRLVRKWNGKKIHEMTPELLLETHGVEARNWATYQALIGCETDNIPKIRRGFGPVTARRFLREPFQLTTLEKQYFNRNLKLTRLVSDFGNYPVPRLRTQVPSKDGWIRFEQFLEERELLAVWGIRSKVAKVSRWCTLWE